MEHTKEPWYHGGYGVFKLLPDVEEFDDFENEIAECNLGADARRIVACVNACAGYDTERLEARNLKIELDSVVAQSYEQVSMLLKLEKHIKELNSYIKQLEAQVIELEASQREWY